MIKICKRCLLSELDGEELISSVRQRISLLDESVRADEREYHHRLDRCKSCDNLTNGMCALCGCFAELRAAKKEMHCPDTPRRW